MWWLTYHRQPKQHQIRFIIKYKEWEKSIREKCVQHQTSLSTLELTFFSSGSFPFCIINQTCKLAFRQSIDEPILLYRVKGICPHQYVSCGYFSVFTLIRRKLFANTNTIFMCTNGTDIRDIIMLQAKAQHNLQQAMTLMNSHKHLMKRGFFATMT